MQEFLKRIILIKIALIFYVLFSTACLAHNGTSRKLITTDNPDSLFYVARELAFSGKYEAARNICYETLDAYPNYHDFRILATRTLAWQSQFDSAQTVLAPVLNDQPSHYEALLTMADIELWKKSFTQALQVADTGLYYYPEDSIFTDKRAEILRKMNESGAFPPETGFLGNDSNAIGMSYFLDFFRYPYIARRHMLSLEYSRKIQYGPLLTRVNIGDNVFSSERLFTNLSYQIEADYYPKITNNNYLYLNYGIATGSFFPSHRAGIEWFGSVGERAEISFGGRFLYWNRSIIFITASVARYFDSYWLSFRPFYSPIGSNNTFSFLIELRRYLQNPQSFVFTSITFGDSPDQPLSMAEEYGNFRSAQYRIGFRYRLKKWYLGSGIGYQYEEYLSGTFRNRFQLNVSAAYVF